GRVDEDADDLRLAAEGGGDLRRRPGVDVARRVGVVDQTDRPGPEAHRLGGVVQIGDPTELDAHPSRLRDPERNYPDACHPLGYKRRGEERTARGAGLPPGGGVLPSALRRGFFDLRGPFAQRHGRSLFVAIAEQLQRHFVTGLLFVDEFDDLFHVGDLLAVGFDDDVAAEGDFGTVDGRLRRPAFDPGLVRRAALFDRLDQDAFLHRQVDRL